jgi:hypothetical protein
MFPYREPQCKEKELFIFAPAYRQAGTYHSLVIVRREEGFGFLNPIE